MFQTAVSTNNQVIHSDSTNSEIEKIQKSPIANPSNQIKIRLERLNEKSPIDLIYNQYVENSIQYYLGKNT